MEQTVANPEMKGKYIPIKNVFFFPLAANFGRTNWTTSGSEVAWVLYSVTSYIVVNIIDFTLLDIHPSYILGTTNAIVHRPHDKFHSIFYVLSI